MARKRRSRRSTSTPVGTSPSTGGAATKKTKASGKGAWKVMDRSTSIVAGLVATRASSVAWRAVTGKRPPTSGRHPDVSTREAVAWAVVGGALVELVQVGVRRSAANYWVKSTGQLPPGMRPLSTPAAGTTKEPVLAEPAPRTTGRSKKKSKLSRRSRGR